MLKISFFIKTTFVVILFVTSILSGQISKEDLVNNINIDKLNHPYLFFSEDEKKVLLERIKTDTECKNIWESLVAQGHRFLYVPVKKPAPVQPEHPRFVSEDPTIAYIAELRRGATTLAFLYQMTGDKKYADKAIEFAIAICDLDYWIDNAHKFEIIYPRVWPWNVSDDQVVFSYDIMAAGKALTVATVYDWVYPALTHEQKDKIRNGLLEKAITRVRGNYEFFWWSTSYRCNWTAICFSGLGLTALTLLKENPQIIDVAAEAFNRLNLTFEQIDEDGGWQEGRGYYVYMMRESILFMDALKRLTNGKYNLFKHEKISSHPMDFLLYALTANFGDSHGNPSGPTEMVNKLVQETGNSTGAWYRNQFLGDGEEIFDIIWPRSDIKPIEPEQKSKLFRGIDWAILRSDFLNPAAVTIAAKAGYNNDPHHGHLDCGHFILTWHGLPFIRDIGRMRYDEFYFNEDRYDYPFASSEGHNLIFVNGEKQIIAKKKNQPWKEGVGGEILDFKTGDSRDYILMDPTKAYPGKELKKWRRNIVLEKPDITVVLDEVAANSGSEVKARFFPGLTEIPVRSIRDPRYTAPEPGIEYKVNDNYVFLTNKKHNMVLIPLVLENDFHIEEDKLSYLPVTEDARIIWIPYFETVIRETKSDNSFIVTIILPVENETQAEDFVRNSKVVKNIRDEIEVSISTPKGNYKWLYEKDMEGYRLKDS